MRGVFHCVFKLCNSCISNIVAIHRKRATKDTRGTVKLINRNKLTISWLKMKKTDQQTTAHMTQHRKLKNK